MREIFKYGSVGGALGDRRIYPEINLPSKNYRYCKHIPTFKAI
jgi:hypothetical protein